MTDLGQTPSQTVGPYLAIGLFRDTIGPELVDPADSRALRVSGILLDGAGEPVPDGMVEIWQANGAGRYRHKADTQAELPLEDGFLGFGRSGTADGGTFFFTTIKPGAVPWPDGGLQAPHLVVAVFARGLLKHAVTRMYFPDEAEANAADPILSRLGAAAATLVAATLQDGSLRFDIRLQGPGQTTFFAV